MTDPTKVVLLGAGASYGCGMDNPPPLGKELYQKISERDIGPRATIKNQSPDVELSPEPADVDLQQNIKMNDWVYEISKDAYKFFKNGEFESGMRVLEKWENDFRQQIYTKHGYGGRYNRYTDLHL